MIPPCLILGNGTYLTITGAIESSSLSAADVASYRTIVANFDADGEGAPGPAVRLTDENRSYWTGIARAAGHDLNDLISA